MQPEWIAVDWGTSRLRAWAMAADCSVLQEAQSDDGMGGLAADAFEPALLRLISDWLQDGRITPVLACGMVGARQGWIEAPYRPVPSAPVAKDGLVVAPCNDPRLSVRIVPGMSQSSPADVMRGEEVQIAGLLAGVPEFDGVLCLPGTHTKWARISAGEVVSFQTFMTGELFALLSEKSVLRHSLAGDGWNEDAFDAAVHDGLSRPERLAARLFSLRAETLLDGLEPGAARARLSGALIGAELAAAKPYWLGQDVAIIGEAAIGNAYARALSHQGLSPKVVEGDVTVRAGLTAAWRVNGSSQ